MDTILVDACTPLLDHFNKRPEDGLWTDIIMRMRGVHFVAYLTEGARLKTRDETLGVVSFPDPAPLRGKEGLVDFLGILCVSNHVTHAYAHAHFSNKRVIRELRIVSCPGGGVWVAVTREFERDNCVISEILQSDWTIPNRAGVPRKSTKVPRPSFRVWAGRSGHETTLGVRVAMDLLGSIMGSMDKPPTPSERERKMQKGELVVRTPLRTVVRLWDCVR